jgi:hypothetical protein
MSERQRDLDAITQAAVDAIGPLLAAAMKRINDLDGQVRELTARLDRTPTPPPGRDGRDGTNGRDGIDATFREPVDYEAGKSYPLGSIVRHRGGLWHAHRTTDAAPEAERSGWSVIVQGVARVAINQAEDSRTFAVELELSSGELVRAEFVVPVVIYRGVHVDGNAYQAGDSTTFNGSLWIARRATDKRPGVNKDDWQLAVKKGTDGRPGENGANAPQFLGFYDPRETYPANALVRTSSGLWLSLRQTAEPPPADHQVIESKAWRMYLPTVTH